MIYEHAHVVINSGEGEQFEQAFNSHGRTALLAAPNCQSAQLFRNAEEPGRYLAVIGWGSLEDHLVTFPDTPQAAQLEAAIAHFFMEPPVVEHFEAEAVA